MTVFLYSPVRFKVARRDGVILNASPEFDDCARIASERNVPVKDAAKIRSIDQPFAGHDDPRFESSGPPLL